MAAYLIGYDLNKQKNYPKLYDAIKSFGTWCHPIDSTWIIKSNLGSIAIRDMLQASIDKDDDIFVIKLAAPGDAAWYGLSKEVSDWLQSIFDCYYQY